MSGGYFDYKQHEINDVIRDLEEILRDRAQDFEQRTIDEFIIAIGHLQIAAIYVQRIDWLLSGDDAEDTFHERLARELCTMLEALEEKHGGNA